jgi:hypothetical protein
MPRRFKATPVGSKFSKPNGSEIWLRYPYPPGGFQQRPDFSERLYRLVQMLENILQGHVIKRAGFQAAPRQNSRANIQAGPPSRLNRFGIRIESDRRKAKPGSYFQELTISAAGVEKMKSLRSSALTRLVAIRVVAAIPDTLTNTIAGTGAKSHP